MDLLTEFHCIWVGRSKELLLSKLPFSYFLCRGNLKKQHVEKKKQLSCKVNLNFFVSLTLNPKNLKFLLNFNRKKLNSENSNFNLDLLK